MSTETQSPLLGIIPTGRENAQKGHEFASLLGWELREVTKTIQQLRRAGYLICASRHGYFLPDNDEDIEKFANFLSGRAVETQKTLQVFTDYLATNDEDVV